MLQLLPQNSEDFHTAEGEKQSPTSTGAEAGREGNLGKALGAEGRTSTFPKSLSERWFLYDARK